MAEAGQLDLRNIAEGAPVATADGTVIGIVGDILAHIKGLWPVDLGEARSLFATPTPGGYGAGENVYFEVLPANGTGTRQPLYVPATAITMAGQEGIRLSVHQDEIAAQGWTRPPQGYPGD